VDSVPRRPRRQLAVGAGPVDVLQRVPEHVLDGGQVRVLVGGRWRRRRLDCLGGFPRRRPLGARLQLQLRGRRSGRRQLRPAARRPQTRLVDDRSRCRFAGLGRREPFLQHAKTGVGKKSDFILFFFFSEK